LLCATILCRWCKILKKENYARSTSWWHRSCPLFLPVLVFCFRSHRVKMQSFQSLVWWVIFG
jgi:hypothetical protein